MSIFFKVVLQQSLQDGKLKLPPKFVRKFERNLPDFALFELPNGGIWKLRLQKTNGEVWLREGWADFANYYSIEHGNFLIITYHGNDKFHVQIFGLNGMEIDYPANPVNPANPASASEEESDESEASIQILDDDFPTYPNTRKAAEQKKRTRETTETRPKSAPKRKFKSSSQGHGHGVSKQLDKVEAIRRKEASKCKNPFFVVGVQPSYFKGNYMYVPNTFIEEHLRHGFINIDLQTWDGRTWPVVLKTKPRARICVGWTKFHKDNNLEVGDAIVFELINGNPFSFRVRIY